MKFSRERIALFQSLLRAPKPEEWRTLTEQDIAEAQAWLKSETRQAWLVSGIVWAVLALPGIYYAATEMPFLWLFIFAGSFFWLVVAGVVTGTIAAPDELEPLKGDAHRCKEAMAALANPNVMAYRDAVVACGRELRIGDAKCMQLIAEDMDTERTCRIVHGLSAA